MIKKIIPIKQYNVRIIGGHMKGRLFKDNQGQIIRTGYVLLTRAQGHVSGYDGKYYAETEEQALELKNNLN